MIYTLVVLVLTAVAFVIGKVRSDVVALISLLALICIFKSSCRYDGGFVCSRRCYISDGFSSNDKLQDIAYGRRQ